MRRSLLTLLVAFLTSLTIHAQYIVSDKYDLWFEDTDYEMTTRKPEYCTEHYQDLRNGCQVRLSGKTVYIYRNGYFCVKQGTWWYAVDTNGDKISGVYGNDIILLNNGKWKCVRGNYVTYVE